MFFRKTAFVLAFIGAAIPAAYANSSVHVVGGEKAFEFHDMSGNKSRADVLKELDASRKNPVVADGGRLLANGALYVFPQHSYGYKEGKLVHTDKLDHTSTSKPNLTMTAEEHRAQAALRAF